MLIIIQESIKNRTNLVYQKSNEVHWVVLRIKHICNTVSNKSLISGLFKISKRYQRDKFYDISKIPQSYDYGIFLLLKHANLIIICLYIDFSKILIIHLYFYKAICRTLFATQQNQLYQKDYFPNNC